MPPTNNKQDRLSFLQFAGQLMTKAEFKAAFERVVGVIKLAEQNLANRIDSRLAELRGIDGYAPVKGKDYFDGAPGLPGERGPKPLLGLDYTIPDPIPGPPGPPGKEATPADEAAMLAKIENDLPSLGQRIRDGLELLEGKERLKASAIDGLDELIAQLKGELSVTTGRTHAQSGPTISVLQAGTQKTGMVQSLNFTGAGAPTITHKFNGVTELSFAASGGGGFTELAATETPDGSRTTFTFPTASAQPSYLVVDNVWMKATSKAGNTNWTWNNGTKVATLTVPAQDDIFGVV